MATSVKLRISKDDPSKPTAQQLAAANQFAKDFAARKGLIIAPDAHVGNALPKFVDTAGNEVTGQSKLPAGTIMDIRQIPSYVTDKNIQYDKGMPYFIDQQTGDLRYIHPDIARSPRFNPMRGQSADSIIAFAKK